MKSISCAFGAAALGQRQFAARNLDHNGHEIFGAIQLEIIDLHGDGEFGDRIAQHQRIFELPLLVGGVELAELFAGEVALAIIQVRSDGRLSEILMRRNLPSCAVFVV